MLSSFSVSPVSIFFIQNYCSNKGSLISLMTGYVSIDPQVKICWDPPPPENRTDLFSIDRCWICVSYVMWYGAYSVALCFRILIPGDMVGAVIGKGGETVRKMSNNTNARYSVFVTWKLASKLSNKNCGLSRNKMIVRIRNSKKKICQYFSLIFGKIYHVLRIFRICWIIWHRFW
jgi:hypothetical protein